MAEFEVKSEQRSVKRTASGLDSVPLTNGDGMTTSEPTKGYDPFTDKPDRQDMRGSGVPDTQFTAKVPEDDKL